MELHNEKIDDLFALENQKLQIHESLEVATNPFHIFSMNGSQKKEKTATSLTDGINLNIKESFSKCALFLGG
ncbi:hypothetical protein DVH24_022799 [Malus domestica]|uniref:Uncharacterized protein n=1 Tax=Malus domestica TaxID=3750 RepID=A0A498KSJ0_MALDO|nr:hypothetical protein DVH24_022799 [Malus domestica]